MRAQARAFFIALSILVTGCAAQLPANPVFPSQYLSAPDNSRLAGNIANLRASRPDKTGVFPLTHPGDAIHTRIAAIRAASKSVDLQVYIFRNDDTGQVISEALLRAAQRGVRVRLLIDDMNNAGVDPLLALLDKEPNIEVRLFNPFAKRKRRLLQLLGDFDRLNRRMHNKTLTIDNIVTFVGGRNIGDEYFGLNTTIAFGDFDFITIGPVVSEVSGQFDLYWNHQLAFPLRNITVVPERKIQERSEESGVTKQAHLRHVGQSRLARALTQDYHFWYWGDASLLHDPPDKILLDKEHYRKFMLGDIVDELNKSSELLILVSPYFVPGENGAEALASAARRGMDIHILTNSLASTDAFPVHGHYRKYRKQLLEAGVHLYETLMVPVESENSDTVVPQRSSLHAKVISIDEKSTFAGSFNMDPRSVFLNTEVGIFIESERLSQELSRAFLDDVRKKTFILRLQGGEIVWHAPDGSVYKSEPDAGFWRRLGATVTGLLPIEGLL
ncbi:phospholipase D-like domain-containing protein [Biformimicrobium ophioploci]|uniref:Phospholipase D family protein n=1 Tax=Biformimicrobium ophioploci TaxID=3036711 RepID=A0ABQ6M2X0_9GAMM|nr:phospholipase D family protein [Microbulbifer sp. NKW57]GMG88701.1 phospholipase D family protein [Microbulbifer sp. NKW57]